MDYRESELGDFSCRAELVLWQQPLLLDISSDRELDLKFDDVFEKKI